MIERKLQRIRDGFQRRHGTIDEIAFLYTRLQRMLPTLARRLGEPITATLEEQLRVDGTIKDHLCRIAMEHGQPPRPSACYAANVVVAEVHHADRASRPKYRGTAVVSSLRQVRAFLLDAWSRLIQDLPEEDLPEFRREAIRLQQREAEQHRQLVALWHLLQGHEPFAQEQRSTA